MAYECQNFKNGQILTAECLNKIDEWLQYICGKEIVSGEVNANGELVLTLCNGETMNIGAVGGITLEQVTELIETALAEAKANGVHVGTEAPTDGQTVWIDTDEEPEEEPEESGTKIDVVANVGQVIAVKAVGADSKPTEFEAVDLPKVTPPDFSANEGEDGFIKNRTHYIDENGIVHKLSNKYIDADWMATSEDFIDPSIIIPEQKVTSTWSNRQMDIQPGIIYDVHINGAVYPCEAWGSGQSVYLGNNTSLTRNDYPFCIYWAGGTATSGMFFHNNTLEPPIYMKVTGHSYTVYNKLPEEFLPDGVVKTVNGSKPDEKGNVSVEIPEGGGSIDVTAEVGQTIVVEEVDGNGKPTKWKAAEYQPRTHWSEPVEVLPETTCEVIEDNGVAMLPDMAISAGDTLTVVFNGTEYTCECADTGGGILAFGNYGAVDEENPVDTGEPFLAMKVWVDESTKGWVAMALDGSATFTLSVVAEKVHIIPERYLPRPEVPEITFEPHDTTPKSMCAPIKDEGQIAILEKAAKIGRIRVSGHFILQGTDSARTVTATLVISKDSDSRYTMYGLDIDRIALFYHVVITVMAINNTEWAVSYQYVS